LIELKWLTRQMILAMHDEAVVIFGGLPGVRDMALLNSAIDRPKNLIAYGDHPSLFDLAAALCFGIVKNHPFLDGNKRTGLLSARALLFLNGQEFEPAEVDEVTMMVGVADATVDEAMLASWLACFSTRRA
jgi:death on curing protein